MFDLSNVKRVQRNDISTNGQEPADWITGGGIEPCGRGEPIQHRALTSHEGVEEPRGSFLQGVAWGPTFHPTATRHEGVRMESPVIVFSL
jgi:hypothetical protein